MFQERGDNIHTHTLNHKIQAHMLIALAFQMGFMQVHSDLTQKSRGERPSCYPSVWQALWVWHTRPANWYPCTHTHTQLWRNRLPSHYCLCMCVRRPQPQRSSNKQTHIQHNVLPKQHCVSLVPNWQDYRREQKKENRLQSINHSCMLLWYRQSPHYPHVPVSSPNVCLKSVSLCVCMCVSLCVRVCMCHCVCS